MIAARVQSESGWHHQYLRATESEQAIQFGEAQVVADREAKGDAIDFRRHNLVSRLDALRFVVLLATGKIDVEEVNLAIAGYQFSIAINQDGGIVKLSLQLRITLDNAPAMHDHMVFARLLLQTFDKRTRDRLRGLIEA